MTLKISLDNTLKQTTKFELVTKSKILLFKTLGIFGSPFMQSQGFMPHTLEMGQRGGKLLFRVYNIC